MKNIKILATNMRLAFINRESVTIGVGRFTPEELRDGGIALKAFPDLLDALHLALPLLEDCAEDGCYKPGYVGKTLDKIKAAIEKAGETH